MLCETHRRRQPDGGPGRSALMAPRGGRRTPKPIRAWRRRAGWGGAGARPGGSQPQVREDRPDDGGIVQRGDEAQPAPTVRTRQHINAKRPVHEGRPRPGAPGGLPLCAVRTWGQRRRRGLGLQRHAPVQDHSLAPTGTRDQHAMANEQVGFRPRRCDEALCARGRHPPSRLAPKGQGREPLTGAEGAPRLLAQPNPRIRERSRTHGAPFVQRGGHEEPLRRGRRGLRLRRRNSGLPTCRGGVARLCPRAGA